jgi:hypothetical protein
MHGELFFRKINNSSHCVSNVNSIIEKENSLKIPKIKARKRNQEDTVNSRTKIMI